MKAKCYLSGAVSNRPIEKARAQFGAAELLASDAFDVVNPLEKVSNDSDWAAAMIICLQELMNCQAILMLPGWMDSAGAKIERDFAERIGMRVLHYEDLNPYADSCECDEMSCTTTGESGQYEACVMCGKVRKVELEKAAV